MAVFGTGAIGATAGGWLVEAGTPVTFVARPETAQRLNREGLHLYAHGREDERRTINVAAVTDVAEIQQPDWLVLAVNNYDLEALVGFGLREIEDYEAFSRSVSRVMYEGMRDMHITSMGQDVYLTKRGATELESLNGYFLRLAEAIGFDARYNRVFYSVTKDWLAQSEIRPMHERELWAKLRQA